MFVTVSIHRIQRWEEPGPSSIDLTSFLADVAFFFFPGTRPVEPFGFVNKDFIGEGVAEETHPGFHSLFHINSIYNVFRPRCCMFEVLSKDRLFIFSAAESMT